MSVGSDGTFGLALLADGTVSAWGTSSNSNASGQLGDGTTVNHASPAPVHNLSGITQIAAGSDHALAIGAGGQVWAWGNNAEGELGDGTLVNRLTPQPVPGLTGVTRSPRASFTPWRCRHGPAGRRPGAGSQTGAADPSCDFINKVTGQNPNAGTTVAAGSAVSVTIGTRPKTPCP